MKNIFLILLSVCLFSCSATKESIFEQEDTKTNLSTSILGLGSGSMIRNHETTLTINSSSNAVYNVKEALTIFSKKDKELAQIPIWYDNFREIDYIKANVLNANGDVIRSYSDKDAEDYSAFDGYTFFSDSRVKVLDLYHNSFPYTIEIEYQINFNGILGLPSWYPKSLNQTVQKASFTVVDKSPNGIRYYQSNLNEEPTIVNSLGGTVYNWQTGFMGPSKGEPYSPPLRETLPRVLVAPNTFEIENTQGSAENWEEFGKWYYGLGIGTRTLSDAAKTEVDDLLIGITDEREKVKLLYSYLQDKARYVSIQLGIGGWKPFSADYVFKNEYGDCKALTNFMQAILEYAGIASNAVLINSDSHGHMLTEFPSNQFNHVILQATLSDGEKIWLECTSKYMPANHLSGGTQGKNALLISVDGGQVIQTPENNPEQNGRVTLTSILISEDGKAEIKTIVKNTGIFQDNLLHSLKPITEKKRLEWLEDDLRSSEYKMSNVDFSGLTTSEEGARYSYELEMDNFATRSSSRLFVPVNALNQWQLNPPESKDRKNEVWLSNKFLEKDVYEFELPSDYEMEALPSKVEIENDFGSFYASLEWDDSGKLIYSRELILTKIRLDSEEYEDFRTFFKQVSKADSERFVIVKKG
tara:strand:- start:5632 stop:7554 length:1923 start_codon:yes stop_codon:yes gene_type:complete